MNGKESCLSDSVSIVRDETYGGMGVAHPSPNLENLPVCEARTAVQCISAGHLAGSKSSN